MERKLVRIEKILDIQPIKGADRIEVATVKNWKVVVKKDEFKIGQEIVYFEIDSFLPIREEFEFLRKSSYKKMADDSVGFKIRTAKFKNQISQGLIMPLNILYSDYIIKNKKTILFEPKIGDDVTELLDVVKYEPPIPAELDGVVVGNFPSFIQKTDEERIQNLSEEYEEYKKMKFFASEKMDGTSSTFFINDGEFGHCSRNWQLVFNPTNTFGKIIIQNNLEEKLKNFGRNIAIQGEIIGEGIQGNKYKLIGQKLLVYNIFDIDKFQYVSKSEMVQICKELELETVPTIFENFTLPETIDELLEIANGKSKLNPNVEREGLVWVSIDGRRISFKTISNEFLIKFEE